jgi:hypothetical protein
MKFLYDHKSLPANDFKKIEAGYHAAQQRYDMARQGTRVQDKEAASGQSRAAAAQCMRRRSGWARHAAAGADLRLCRDAAHRCGRHGGSRDSGHLRARPEPSEGARGDSGIRNRQGAGRRARHSDHPVARQPAIRGKSGGGGRGGGPRPPAPTAPRLPSQTRSGCCGRGW